MTHAVYGAGVIQRLKINKGVGGFGQNKDFEPHIGKNRTYMNVYLSDPIVRSLIDLPCLYAVKDNFDIVTADDSCKGRNRRNVSRYKYRTYIIRVVKKCSYFWYMDI